MMQKTILKIIRQKYFIIIGIIALLLGINGFDGWAGLLSYTEAGTTVFFRALINTLQMFVLNLPVDEFMQISADGTVTKYVLNWQVVTAGLLAPISTIGGLLTLFGKNAFQWFSLAWGKKPDYVFIGAGETAAGITNRLCSDLNSSSNLLKYIGLDIKEVTLLSNTLLTNNAKGFVRVGDALSDSELTKLRLYRAKNIWVSAGDDLLNIQIARQVVQQINMKLKPNNEMGKIRIYVHVSDFHLARSAELLFPELNKQFAFIEIMSISRMAARAIFTLCPPQLSARHKTPHILIVGNSPLAEALIIHAVQLCVYDEHEKLNITWIGDKVSENRIALAKKFIGLADAESNQQIKISLPLANIKTIDCDEDEITPDQWQQAQEKQGFDIVYVTCNHDNYTLAAAVRVAALRERTELDSNFSQPILACFWDRNAANDDKPYPLQLLDKELAKDLMGINVYSSIFDPNEKYYGEKRDHRAMLVHAVYCNVFELEGNEKLDDTLREKRIARAQKLWVDEINKGSYRWSSQLSADHIVIKLALLNKLTKPNDENNDRDLGCKPDLIETSLKEMKEPDQLARIEHARFVAERLMEGWLPITDDLLGAKGEMDSTTPKGKNYSQLNFKYQKENLLLNHTLIPYDNIHAKEQAKDHKIANAIPEILRCEALIKN